MKLGNFETGRTEELRPRGDTEISDLKNEIAESAVSYPHTVEQVKWTFQDHADKLTDTIEKQFTGDRSLNQERWKLQVTIDTQNWWYAYKLTSYGITTLFKFVPEFKKGKPEAWRIVLYYQDTEYFSSSLDSLSDRSSIQTILWYANSANKDFYRCKDYKRLNWIASKIQNPYNKEHLSWYKKEYTRIMKTENFYSLQFDASMNSSTSRPFLDIRWKQTAYMNARRANIKHTKKAELDKLFAGI